MFILTIAGREKEGAYSVVDDDGDSQFDSVANMYQFQFKTDPHPDLADRRKHDVLEKVEKVENEVVPLYFMIWHF